MSQGWLEEARQMVRNCPLCGHGLDADGTIASVGGLDENGRVRKWTAFPAVIHEDGRVGHARCFILEGTVSIGDETGPEFVERLDEMHRASGLYGPMRVE